VRHGAVGWLVLGLLGCRTIGARPEPELSVDKLEVTFLSASRGQLDLGLRVQGGGTAVKAQWQLLLDGQPLGSGVQVLAQRLAEGGPSVVLLSAPLLTAHAARDQGWRTVTLEVAGELTVQRRLEERLQFTRRQQVLIRGAPTF
jgi:hypothetical protein